MIIEITIPSVGESITEATLTQWFKQDGEEVKKDEPLFEIETEKATLEVVAQENGILSITVPAGQTVAVGAPVGAIDTTAVSQAGKSAQASRAEKPLSKPTQAVKPADPAAASAVQQQEQNSGGLISRRPMSPIRQRIAEHLLEAQQNTAMLTTFNEIDMSRVQAIRNQVKESFKENHGVSLGIMPFFVKASVTALKEFPQLNSVIEGKDIIEHHYYHIGIAVGSERGLVVPVIRHADKLDCADLEQAIENFVQKVSDHRVELSDLVGGTFTISNGGVYGSLLSTPILNMPQSGILGMHKIEKRPVVVNDEIVIRPMMYVALSYDHRIVDGREAVTFLNRIKECIEKPEDIITEFHKGQG
jgi:2-oxoglutarate dehydrogenase E2 component (dihydrolipoamide succinyltransferase)